MTRRSTVPVALSAVLAALPATGCSGSKDTGVPFEEPGPSLTSIDGRLRDGAGRDVLLRGLNARVDGLFDVTFDDGRIPLEEIPTFTQADCRFMSETLGLNHLRLPVNWSGIEPEPQQYDQAYLDRIGALVDDCLDVGVRTIVDLHQDAYGKDIGEDGAPLWAIHPALTEDQLLEGPLTSEELAERRFSSVVLTAFSHLYANTTLDSGRGVRDAYAEMTAVLAQALADHPGAVALELHNEPVVFGDQASLDAFHAALTEAVREVAPTLPVVFEPDALRNINDKAPTDVAFGFDNTVYGPHIYTDVFETGWADMDIPKLEQSIADAESEAAFHSAHLYVGEFGHDPRTEVGSTFIATALDAFDTHRASWAMWLYEEHSQDSWGLWDEGDLPHTRGELRPQAVSLLSRAYPEAIAGDLNSLSWDGQTLTVAFSKNIDAPHILRAPSQWIEGATLTCGGEATHPVRTQDSRVWVECADSPLTWTAPSTR